MLAEPFFSRDDAGRYLPNDICRGPWDPNSLHGRVISGLLAHEIETRWGSPEFLIARLTVDMYRVARFAPVEVTSRAVRDGNRIRVIDADFSSGGESIARASAVLLRKTDAAEGNVWTPPDWAVARPADLPAPATQEGRVPMWETRVIDNGFGSTERKRAWLRETRGLVEGVELTPFIRAAFAADFTNPFANSGSEGLKYVNADITLYLHRLPEGEWLGFEVASHHAAEGIAVGECTMYDEAGAVGRSTVVGLSNRRKAT
jgi:hypothetical protein